MKRMMMMMAMAMIAAVSVQASSLTWGSSASGFLYMSDGVTKSPTGNPSTVALVLVLLPSAGYDVALDTSAEFVARIKSSTAAVNIMTAGVVTGSLTGVLAANNGQIYQIYGLTGGNYFKIYDNVTTAMVGSYTVSGIVSGTEAMTTYQPGTGLPADALKLDSAAITFVPEPTSMALLALGAAALGLRRKFRA